jgi:hypothetical protein
MPVGPNGGNRVLSIATGVDWLGTPADLAFRPEPKTLSWRSLAYRELQRRGHFLARRDHLRGLRTALLLNSNENTRSEALAICLEPGSELIRSYRLDGPWPAGAIMVMAGDGSDVGAVRHRTSGRILVVEYPPRAGQSWSRIWRYGAGWPDGSVVDPATGMGGSIPVAEVLDLLSNPQTFRWREPSERWPGANRWLAFLQWARPVVAGALGLAGACLAIVGVYYVSQERRSALLVALLRLLALTPAAVVLGGAAARVAGLSAGPLWPILALLALGAVVGGLDVLWPSQRWTAIATINLATLLAFDPTYAALGSLDPIRPPGELLGAALASAALIVLELGRLRSRGEMLGILLLAAIGAAGYLSQAWWGADAYGALSLWWLVAALSALGKFRKMGWLVAAFVSPGVVALLTRGISFSPRGLVATYRDLGTLNLFEHLSFIVSPAVVGALFLLGAGALFGSGFLAHELRAGWRLRLEARSVMGVALACALAGLTYPPLLHAALWCVFASGIIVLECLLRPTPPLE